MQRKDESLFHALALANYWRRGAIIFNDLSLINGLLFDRDAQRRIYNIIFQKTFPSRHWMDILKVIFNKLPMHVLTTCMRQLLFVVKH